MSDDFLCILIYDIRIKVPPLLTIVKEMEEETKPKEEDRNQIEMEPLKAAEDANILRTRAAGRVFPGESWCDGENSFHYIPSSLNIALILRLIFRGAETNRKKLGDRY